MQLARLADILRARPRWFATNYTRARGRQGAHLLAPASCCFPAAMPRCAEWRPRIFPELGRGPRVDIP